MSTPAPTSRRTAAVRLLLATISMPFWPLAPVLFAQPAINSIANIDALPLRNLQVEMRQVQTSSQSQPGSENQFTTTAQQQVLVLNGRTGHIGLRTSVPMRMMAVAYRQGRPILIPGVVLLDATTGFRAVPRWDGTDTVLLELAATQAANAQTPHQGASASSTVAVPVGVWTTVAESDQAQSHQRSDWLGEDGAQSSRTYALQVRISPR